MRLQRHIPQVLLRDDAQRIGVRDDCGRRDRHCRKQPSHVDEREAIELDWTGMDGEDMRRDSFRTEHAEITPVRRVPVSGTTVEPTAAMPVSSRN